MQTLVTRRLLLIFSNLSLLGRGGVSLKKIEKDRDHQFPDSREDENRARFISWNELALCRFSSYFIFSPRVHAEISEKSSFPLVIFPKNSGKLVG